MMGLEIQSFRGKQCLLNLKKIEMSHLLPLPKVQGAVGINSKGSPLSKETSSQISSEMEYVPPHTPIPFLGS